MAGREIPTSNCPCFFPEKGFWGTCGSHFRFMRPSDIPVYPPHQNGPEGPMLPFETYDGLWISVERCPSYYKDKRADKLL